MGVSRVLPRIVFSRARKGVQIRSAWDTSQKTCNRPHRDFYGHPVRGPLIIVLYVLIQPYCYKPVVGHKNPYEDYSSPGSSFRPRGLTLLRIPFEARFHAGTGLHLLLQRHVYLCICICRCICVYIYIYMCIYIYLSIYLSLSIYNPHLGLINPSY